MFLLALLATFGLSARPRIAKKGSQVRKNDNDDDCMLCNVAVPVIESYMKDARTISQIVKSIEKLCEYVDENVRDVCQTIIVDNVPKIIAYIEQLMEAHDVCWEIGICK